MSKQEKEEEKNYRRQRFDCETRFKIIELASKMEGNLQDNTKKIGSYVFSGLFPQAEEVEKKSKK